MKKTIQKIKTNWEENGESMRQLIVAIFLILSVIGLDISARYNPVWLKNHSPMHSWVEITRCLLEALSWIITILVITIVGLVIIYSILGILYSSFVKWRNPVTTLKNFLKYGEF